jgi:organic radical activating enzyme
MASRDYYCNFKFKFLKIDLTSNTIYNCHAATPHRIDYEWLRSSESNDLFNTEISINERNMMLNNERNSSCEQNCWHAEDSGGISPRLWQGGDKKTHTIVHTNPEIIDLTIGRNCNLTCTYCCKEFSTSWLRDVIDNGEYLYTNADSDLLDRNTVSLREQISLKVKQNDVVESEKYKLLFNEIVTFSPMLEELIITGGDPFINNELGELIKKLKMKPSSKIIIYTGLGFSFARFKKYISMFSDNISSMISLRISADGIGKHLEFNRYGIKWDEFVKKIDYLKEQNIDFEFQTTLSNLSVFGFADFYKKFSDYGIRLTFAYTPRMMSIYVMDDESKNIIKNEIEFMPDDVKSKIISSISPEPTETQRIQIKEFLEQFTSRREDLSLDIFPNSFLKWVGI